MASTPDSLPPLTSLPGGSIRPASKRDPPKSSQSNSLYQSPAEDAVGPDHQRDDHQDVRSEVVGAAADVRIEIAGREILDDADDDPADHGTDDRVKAAENHHRKHFQTHHRELVVDAEHRSPHHAAERRNDPGHRPGERKVAADVDAHRHRNLLAVGTARMAMP